MKLLFVILVVTCFIPLSAVAQEIPAANPASLVDDFADMSADEQMAFSESIQGKQWYRLSEQQRLELQKAAVSYSERVLGRDENGVLKAETSSVGKQLLKIAGDYLHHLPPGEVPAHGAAQAIYGSIPEDAERVTGSAKINARRVRMHSTGFYAAPGEVVVVEVPKQWTDRGLEIWISGHRDNIPLKRGLLRTPRGPARKFRVDKARTEVASTYGGAVYIDTGDVPIDADPFPVNFAGALLAPTYIHGKTTLDDWQNTQRHHSGPYAEFVGRNVAMSFPADWIRELDDPASLMDYWDGVVGLHDQLGGYTDLRNMPERVNVDCQISVGLFHAGYPTQGPQSHCRGVVDLPELTSTGNWGWFHELGHEAQRRPDKAWSWNNPYTFDGSSRGHRESVFGARVRSTRNAGTKYLDLDRQCRGRPRQSKQFSRGRQGVRGRGRRRKIGDASSSSPCLWMGRLSRSPCRLQQAAGRRSEQAARERTGQTRRVAGPNVTSHPAQSGSVLW